MLELRLSKENETFFVFFFLLFPLKTIWSEESKVDTTKLIISVQLDGMIPFALIRAHDRKDVEGGSFVFNGNLMHI